MTHILHTRTVHKTASLADEGNYVYLQSSGAQTYINLWKLALRGHLNTDFAQENDALTTRPQLSIY